MSAAVPLSRSVHRCVWSLVPLALPWLILLTLQPCSYAAPASDKEPAPAPRAELVFTRSGPARCFYHVAFSPDGKLLAASGTAKTITLWDAVTGEEVRTLRGHSADVYSAAFSPDGKLLASASEDHTVKLWEVASGTLLRTFIGHTSDVYHVAYSPDGKTLASASQDQTVRLWDVATSAARRTLSGHTARVCTVAFSPDGRRLASTSPSAPRREPGPGEEQGEVKVWDVGTGQELYTLPRTPAVITIVFSPDGRRLAGSCLDHTVRLWELATGLETRRLTGHHLEVYNVAFSPDGRRLAACSGHWSDDRAGEVRIWDLPGGRELLSFRPHSRPIWSLALCDEGRRLATASGKWLKSDNDKGKTIHGEVKVWRLLDLPPHRPAMPPPRSVLESLWLDLADANTARAYEAVWALSESPRRSLPFLREHVRAVPVRATAEQIARLVQDLDHTDFAVREKATAALEQLGSSAYPVLRQARQSPSLEVRRRAGRLLERKGDGLPVLTPDELRGLRVVEVLLHIGTEEARPILQKLAGGDPGSPLTEEAATALASLTRAAMKR
jgi:WD40 repeat protein